MKIAIWGAGCFGNYVLEQLRDNDTIHVACFIDQNADLKEENDIRIVTPDVFLEEYRDEIDCVIVAFLDGIRIAEQLKAMGISLWGIVRNCVLQKEIQLEKDLLRDHNILWNSDKEINLPFMETLETNVVDYCNLNCKGCSHFSNIFREGEGIPFDIFERDIRFLADKIYIRQFNLLGGEALLSKRIKEYFHSLAENMPKTDIVLVTNGILIPKLAADVLESMVKYNVMVSITEYPPVTYMKEKIISVLRQYGISYEFRGKINTFGKNIDLSGQNDPMNAQGMCRENTCQFLRDGKIYKCPFSALANYYFDRYNIPLHFQEGIDIFDKTINWKELITKLRNYPINACKYCGMEEEFSWDVSKFPKKEEWLIS